MRHEVPNRRRRLAAVLVCLALASACGGKDAKSAAPTVPGDSGGSTTVADGDQTTVAGGTVKPTTTVKPGGGGSSGGTPAPTVSGGATNPTSSVNANVDVGQLAAFYLRPSQSSTLVVEVSAQSGTDPAAGNVSHLQNVLHSVSGKPVTVDGPRRLDGGARSWSAQELRNLADSAARTGQGNGKAVLRLLFLHGDYNGDAQVLGISVRGDVAAIFSDRLADAASPITGATVLEDAVMEHEAGHLLGLVDLYLHTGRQDPDHPGHSTNKSSVMYWAVESSLVTDLLTGGPPRDFDSADLADLKTIRNG
jgi:hypothetical protein